MEPIPLWSISAKALARNVTSAKLFAGDSEKTIEVSENADTYFVEFSNYSTSDITFGFEGVGTKASESWLCVDNFTMRFVRAITVDDYSSLYNDAVAKVTALEGKIPAAAYAAAEWFDGLTTSRWLY